MTDSPIIALAAAIEVDSDSNISLGGLARHSSAALSTSKEIADSVPRFGNQRTGIAKCVFRYQPFTRLAVGGEENPFCAEISCQHYVGGTVADNKRGGEVVTAIEIFPEQCGARLASGRVLMLESAVDDNVVKFHAFAGKCLENLVVWLPKSILGKRIGA